MMGSFSMERLSAKVCENRESTSKRGLRTQAVNEFKNVTDVLP